jgi:2-desacetyl-2-hydroxyethyl bacteriochlorophyllide A dehydrogenase
MRALVCKTPGTFDYKTEPIPVPKPGEILLQMQRVGICGTDFHAFSGNQPYFNYPRILGHEISGRILENNSNKQFNQNELVTILPYLNCGICQLCRTGKSNCCIDLKVLGVHTDGAMREFITVNAEYVVNGSGLGADELCIVEPIAIGAHAVNRAKINKNDLVLVVGAGPIGMGIIYQAKQNGNKVVVIDPIQSRLEFCKRYLGADGIIDCTTDQAINHLAACFNGALPSVIFEATGNLSAIEGTLNLLAHGGKIILVGLQKHNFSFSHPEFHKKETTLLSSRNATKAEFINVINNLKSGTFPVKGYITHRCNFSNLKEIFNNWTTRRAEIIKAIVSFD